MKPVSIFLFLLLVLASIGAISFFYPTDGIKISSEKNITFPNLISHLQPQIDTELVAKQIQEQKQLEKIVEEKKEIEKKLHKTIKDTLQLMEIAATESKARFYFANDDRAIIEKMFNELEKAQRDNTTFRIIHYGDSQIEMDRISSYLRNQLQSKFGGGGIGLLPAFEITPKTTVRQENTGTWERKLSFGVSSGRAKHNRYGPMGYFCKKTSNPASVVFNIKDNKFKNQQCKIIVGALDKPLDIKLVNEGKEIGKKTLEASSIEQMAIFGLDSAKGKISIQLNGANAEIQAISFEDKGGVLVDNIPMRGYSGDNFSSINLETLRKTYKMLNTKMVILQFGGNALPGLKSKAGAQSYGSRMLAQINYLKAVDPNLIILVIGPADMSIKQDGKMITHPQLENVRDALKNATLKGGGFFWDIYEAMGGRGSMNKWVNGKENLAAPDYIHFSQKGANKIAKIFYQTLMEEYDMYKLKKTIPEAAN